jgi:hypothetical protein
VGCGMVRRIFSVGFATLGSVDTWYSLMTIVPSPIRV